MLTKWPIIFLNGLEFSFIFTLFLIYIVLNNNMILLHNLPPEIRRQLPSKSRKERKMTIAILVIGLFFAFTYLFRFTHKYTVIDGFIEKFVYTVIHSGTILCFFCVWDFLIIDCLGGMIMLKKRWFFIPGIDPKLYLNYQFHFEGFINGIGYCLSFSLLVSFITAIILHFD